ncbi:AMP-binding protein [bacterium]|nr:AMP-binding protein [bacterium]
MEAENEIAWKTSIAEMFLDRVRSDRGNAALWFRPAAEAPYQSATWQQLLRDVYVIVRRYEELGLFSPGDRVVHIRDNCREWITLDLALMFLGVWHVSLSTHMAADQVVSIVEHCRPKLAIVALDTLFQKLQQHFTELEVQVVRADQKSSHLASPLHGVPEEWDVIPADEMLADLEARCARIEPDQTCTLVYTSGTTGQPKGVMLSHRNLAFDAQATTYAYSEKPADKRLSFLPFNHLYARTCDVYTWYARGSQLALAFARETILEDCQQIQPTLINGVPYFYQKVAEGLKLSGKLEQAGTLRAALGGEVRMCSSGGAPLAPWVIDAFEKQNLALLEGYGLTETSPVITVSTEDSHRSGSVGRAIDGVEIRVTEDAEIETSGPHVMQGYYRNEDATQQVMDGAWLRTGDLGLIDDDGYLWITGRKKEILVLSTGRKVNPQPLELAIGSDPLVAQVIVCGEGRKCLSALIVPEPEQLRERIKSARLWFFSKEKALNHPKVRQWFRDAIDCQLANRSDYEQIGPFTILGYGFTPASGELTPKLSLRRDAILKNHHDKIEQMYNPPQVSQPWWHRWLP